MLKRRSYNKKGCAILGLTTCALECSAVYDLYFDLETNRLFVDSKKQSRSADCQCYFGSGTIDGDTDRVTIDFTDGTRSDIEVGYDGSYIIVRVEPVNRWDAYCTMEYDVVTGTLLGVSKPAKSSGLGTAALAGIGAAGAVLIAVVVVLAVRYYRKRRVSGVAQSSVGVGAGKGYSNMGNEDDPEDAEVPMQHWNPEQQPPATTTTAATGRPTDGAPWYPHGQQGQAPQVSGMEVPAQWHGNQQHAPTHHRQQVGPDTMPTGSHNYTQPQHPQPHNHRALPPQGYAPMGAPHQSGLAPAHYSPGSPAPGAGGTRAAFAGPGQAMSQQPGEGHFGPPPPFPAAQYGYSPVQQQQQPMQQQNQPMQQYTAKSPPSGVPVGHMPAHGAQPGWQAYNHSAQPPYQADVSHC